MYNMCGLSFMKALHFSFPFPLTVGLLLWFFCNWEFIFKYYIVIMTRGSFLPELHSYICNFFWLMGKQLPHQSFSPGPIICQHLIKPHIAMQIIVPRDLQYNHPVTKKVKRKRNYHNGPQNIHKRMLRGLYGRFHHHYKAMLAFPGKCALLCEEILAPSWRNLNFSYFYGSDWLGWILHIHLSKLWIGLAGFGIVLEGVTSVDMKVEIWKHGERERTAF